MPFAFASLVICDFSTSNYSVSVLSVSFVEIRPFSIFDRHIISSPEPKAHR